MKKILKFSLLVSCLAASMAGCKKDPGSGSFPSYVRGKIEGVPFECTNIGANKPEPGPSGQPDPVLRITGDWPDYSIKLLVIDYNLAGGLTPGTFTFEIGKNYSATIWQNNSDSYFAGPAMYSPPPLYGNGNITILEISKYYVRGTFRFTTDVNAATGVSKSVTEGEFYINRD